MLPFTGSFEFKLTFGAFGARVVRSARIDYVYLPTWPYYDPQCDAESTGDFRLDINLCLLARSRSSPKRMNDRPPEQHWAPAEQLLASGILGARIRDQFRRCIDAAAREMDRRNRLQAGRPVSPLPDEI